MKHFKSHLAIMSANILFGLNFTVAKGIMPNYALPYGLTLCRIIGAGLMFWLLGLFAGHEKIERKDLKLLFASGVFGVSVNQLLFLKGLSLTTPIDAAIIMTLIPIMVMFFAYIFLKERITWLKVLGIGIGATGSVILILFSGELSLSSATFWGNLMQFFNALCYAYYLVLVKPLMAKYRPLTVMKWVFAFGFLIIAPVGTHQLLQINWSQIPMPYLMSIAYIVFGTTFLGYLLNIYGMQALSPATISTYIYAQPFIAVLASIIVGNDHLTSIKIFSGILVFVGVYLVTKTNNQSRTLIVLRKILK